MLAAPENNPAGSLRYESARGEMSETEFSKARADLASGLTLWPLWVQLGWNGILQRYRRSFLRIGTRPEVTKMKKHVVVALVATKGVEDFLENSLKGLVRVGIDPRIIHVARPLNAAETIDPIILKAGAVAHSFSEFCRPSIIATPEHYANYGTEPFVAVVWEKIRYVRWLLDRYSHVVYADLDVGWLADPLWYLAAVGEIYPLAFQTEAQRRFPPILCTGFLSAKSTATTLGLFDRMLAACDSSSPGTSSTDDQQALNAIIAQEPALLNHIHLLSEGLFVNGLGYRHFLDSSSGVTMQGKLEPIVFHANWTVGLKDKKQLMANAGTWLLD